ncbi:MAG: HipA family kinase [Bacteroidales bacterium]
MFKTVNSISSPEKVFETHGSQPILILCDDFDFYVCKYNRWPGGAAKSLLHEFLAGSFARLWNLAVPEFCFVNVNPSHVEGIAGLQPFFFHTLCFGSRFKRLIDIDEFYTEISSTERRKFHKKTDYLKIALFDIWLANEDRHFKNYNLLIDAGNDYRFVPIDHVAIFNTGNLDKGLTLITEDESLISTELTRRLFSRKELLNREYLTNIQNECYICISDCEKNVDNFLGLIPENWKINIKDYQKLLKEHLFNEKWVKDCLNYFLELIQIQT